MKLAARTMLNPLMRTRNNLMKTYLIIVTFFMLLSGYSGTIAAQSLTASDTAEVRLLNGRKFFLYDVKKGETLFSISQKFDIPQDELTELNPTLREGLKPKTRLWIPAFSWKTKVKQAESEKTPVTETKKNKDNRSIHIAIISNLDLAKTYSGEADETDTAAQERINGTTLSDLEFTEGALAAIDKFHSSNGNFKIRTSIVDSQGDSSYLNKTFWKSDWRKADVWITNESGAELSYLNRLSEKSGILLISCGVNTSDRISSNPHGVALLPSSLLQCRIMGAAAATMFKNANAVFVKTNNPKESERMLAMKQGWSDVNPGWTARVSDYSKGFGKSVLDSMRSSKQNVIFIPSSNEDMITGLLLALKDRKNTYDFTVVGLPTWYGFETIDPALMQDCNVHYFNSGSIESRPAKAAEFRKSFRDEYNSEPGESAYIGYDAAKLLLENFKKSGDNLFIKELPTLYEGIYSDYKFKRAGKDEHSENQHINIWSFKELIPEQIEH